MKQESLGLNRTIITVTGGGRNDLIDSIKGLLIILVVFGHFVFIGPTSFDNKAIYSFVYLFHMPLFIFLSGLYTKRKDKDAFSKGWLRLFEVFVSFSIYYFILLLGFLEVSVDYLLTPIWILWYLCSLLTYRAVFYLIDINKYNPILIILFSFVISIASGFIPWIDAKLAFNRTCTFLPFFVLGLYAQRYESVLIKIMSIPKIICFIVLAVLYYLCEEYEDSFLMMVVSDGHNFYYNHIDIFLLFKLRVLYVIVSVIASICVLNLVPKMEMLSKCGKNSLNIYLLHAFPVWYLGIITRHFDYKVCFITIVSLTVLTIYSINRLSQYKIVEIIQRPFTWIKYINQKKKQ